MGKDAMRFKLVAFQFKTDTGGLVCRHYITDSKLPAPVLNEWLETNYLRAYGTGYEYGKKAVSFLNYLDELGVEYDVATNRHVKAFLQKIIYGDTTKLTIYEPSQATAYSTLTGYVAVITSLYKWLDENDETAMRFGTTSRRASKSYFYGQIYAYNYKYLLGIHLPRLASRHEFVKWYTDSEIEALADGFLTLRDKAVFRITLEGFRIDEVLSMRLADYDPLERSIQPTRSKGRETAVTGQQNPHRLIILPAATCTILDRYIQTERMLAENQSLRISEHLFINLNRGPHQGEPLRYNNYYRVFKTCAARAGLDPAKIRTHSGRSTNVMRMLECGASDAEIMHQTGWRSIESISHYRDDNNPIVAHHTFRKLHPEDGGSEYD
jgi:integrase/recombinase XerD